MEEGVENDPLTEQIIGAAIAIHKALGPGFLESVYENALVVELRYRGLRVEQQVETPILYRSTPVGSHRLDLLVEGVVVVELKAIAALERVHFAILRSYLRATGLDLGLLLNFGEAKLNVKRVTPRWRH